MESLELTCCVKWRKQHTYLERISVVVMDLVLRRRAETAEPRMLKNKDNFGAPQSESQSLSVRVLLLTGVFCSFPAVQSLNNLNDQIAQFMVTRPCDLVEPDEAFMPGERDTLRKSMTLMRHLLMDAQVRLQLLTEVKSISSRLLRKEFIRI